MAEEGKLHPLDPLKQHYDVIFKREQVKLTCNYCDKSWEMELKNCRYQFKAHLLSEHPGKYSTEYQMTKDDDDLKADFQVLGMPDDVMHFRKYICFAYDKSTKRAKYVYCLLSKKLLEKTEMSRADVRKHPKMDIFLDESDQMKPRDYQNLPKPYEVGHIIGNAHFRWSKFIHKLGNCFSIVAIQHGNLNHGHWARLEEYVEGLLLFCKVRIFAGTAGELPLKTTSRAKIPRWWFMIMVTSDEDNTHWRYSAFCFPNLECTANLTDYAVTIPELSSLLKMAIFPNIIDDLKTTFKSERDAATFDKWAMAKWFPGENANPSDDDSPRPIRKKMKGIATIASSESD